MLVMKKVPPNTTATLLVASKGWSLFFVSAAAIDENTSGAPLPNASKVTPAKEFDKLNLKVKVSKAGDKKSSAVDASMCIKKKNINA